VSKIELLGDNSLTPTVLLAKRLEEADDLTGVVVLAIRKNGDVHLSHTPLQQAEMAWLHAVLGASLSSWLNEATKEI